MTTAHELVQQAIDKIERPRKKRRVQAAFDRDPSLFIATLVEECDEDEGDESDEVADYLEGVSSSLDPEKLSKWIELLVKLLPLILKFL